jgi:hypothetical protein
VSRRVSSLMCTFQIPTAGEPIKDAGYQPHAVCAVWSYLALATWEGARLYE